MEKLKKKALKKEGDPVNIMLNRRISIPLSIRLMKTSITPNQVTLLSLVAAILAGIFFSFGTYPFAILAAVFVQIYITLDLMDGEIARLKNMKSDFGRWFEGVTDNIATAAFVIGMTFGALRNPTIILGSFAIPAAWIYMVGIASLVGYYISGFSFYYGIICFKRELTGFVRPKGEGRLLLSIIKSYSRGLQILIFTFAGLLNHLLLGLVLFAVWSNLIWLGRLGKYYRKFRN